MNRAMCALVLGCLGLLTTLLASGITAHNHEIAEDMHHRERMLEMRAAAIENLFIRVHGRVISEPLKSNVQNGSAVSGSSSLGGSRASDSDVFEPQRSSASEARP